MIAVALLTVSAACDSETERPRPPAARVAPAASTAPATPPEDEARELPAGAVAHGLSIPRGGELVASNALGDDYVVPYDVDAVIAHVRSQLAETNFEPIAPAGGRFRRVTPRGAAESVKLYVLVMPYPGRGTMLRVQSLPERELDPETLERNVRRFESEQRAAD